MGNKYIKVFNNITREAKRIKVSDGELTEDQLQAEFWREAWNRYPHAQGNMWAVPNTGAGKILNLKDQIQTNRLKATGLLEGVWDLHLYWEGQLHIIETKVGANQLTVDRTVIKNNRPVKHRGQKEWGEKMAKHGAFRHIYRSLAEGLAIFEGIVGKTPEKTQVLP